MKPTKEAVLAALTEAFAECQRCSDRELTPEGLPKGSNEQISHAYLREPWETSPERKALHNAAHAYAARAVENLRLPCPEQAAVDGGFLLGYLTAKLLYEIDMTIGGRLN